MLYSTTKIKIQISLMISFDHATFNIKAQPCYKYFVNDMTQLERYIFLILWMLYSITKIKIQISLMISFDHATFNIKAQPCYKYFVNDMTRLERYIS
jgi:hypothetical protein